MGLAQSCARALFVGAHLDDIELAAGGTTARICALGGDVYWLVLSDSGYVSFDGRSMRQTDVALEEGHAAARTLGVSKLDVHTFPAKDIDNVSTVVEVIERVVTDFDPTIIFSHWPFDTHRSHANAALTTIAAARRRNSVLMFEPITPSGRSYVAFRPQVYVAIDDVIEPKLEALKCHESEYRKYGDGWIDGVLARARYRGYEMGATFGEAFEVLRLELALDTDEDSGPLSPPSPPLWSPTPSSPPSSSPAPAPAPAPAPNHRA